MCLKYFKKYGNAQIVQPVVFPPLINKGVSFNIVYKIKNTGNVDTLFGHLLVDSKEVSGSYWEQKMKKNDVVAKTFLFPGINKDTKVVLEVGYC